MNYFSCIVLVSFLQLTLSITLPPADANGIIMVTNANWDEIVKSSEYDVVVEFFSPTCGYCIRLEPIWNEIGKYFKSEDTVLIVKVDSTGNEGRIPGIDVTGVPTIMMFPANNKDKPLLYTEHRALTLMIEWILDNVDLPVEVSITYKSQPIPTNNVGPVTEVVGYNWKEIVLNTEKDVFVNFYAPWCPFSAALKQTWLQLAERLKNIPSIVIAQYDGTQNEVPGVHLHAYPTLTLYRAGDNKEFTYTARIRTVDALLKHLQTESVIPFTDPVTGVQSHVVEASVQDHAIDVPELNDETYLPTISHPDKNIVVLYYAPWCAHSQELFKVWEEIALEYRNIGSVGIYQIDASKFKKTGVEIYPTIKLFPSGGGAELGGVTFKGKETTSKNIKEFISNTAVRSEAEAKIQREHKEAIKLGISAPVKYAHLPDYETGQSLIYKEEL